jgi:ABC-type multidrug transport system fused ATPase/permease subunit
VPQRSALLARVLDLSEPGSGAPLAVVPSALFRIRERSAPSRAAWQSGRFVQPVTLDLREAPSLEGREARRREIDRGLASLRLPPGSHLERPDLSWLRLWRAELRLALLALLLPLLWIAAATVRLDSVRAALLLLAPATLGAAAAAAVVWAAVPSGEGAGETTLFALAASLAATLPLAAWAAGATEDRRDRAGRRAGAYRELRLVAPLSFLGAAAWVVLALAPTLGADPGREGWVVPLRAAAAAGGVAAAAFLLLPALLFAPTGRKGGRTQRDPLPVAPADALELPAASPPPHTLAVENLTKVYRGGGRALHRVGFELSPGIVGLLGPNGAGKTTLLRCLVGLLEPTRGRVLVGGRPLASLDRAAYRRGVGFLPQDFNAYPGFTAERFLAYWAAARDLPAGPGRDEEIGKLLEAVALS